jgi:RimJ/RimL family protein N-acetyltransferase
VGELPIGETVDETPAGRPGRGTRTGRFVTLSPVDPHRDADPLFEATRDAPDVWTYLGYGPFDDEAAMRTWLGSLVPQEDPLFLTVTDRASESPVGVVAFMNVDSAMRHLELGNIWYAPVAQRTRVNTDTVYLMLREAFDELGHRRVEWKCDALNARSRSAAVRLGFTFEGVFRQHMVVKGRNRDTAWFSMLDQEWPRIRANMHRWLEADPAAVSLRELNSTL